jgi:transposase
MQALNERINSLNREIAALSSQQTTYRHLLTIPGVGPLIAAAFISEVDASQFSSGRELSAWCGLVPRQHSSGGKQRLSSVTKNGNRSLRTLIIHGARAVMRCVKKREDNLGRWVQELEARRGFLKTTVALANKMTRIIWRVLTDAVDFNMSKAFAMN